MGTIGITSSSGERFVITFTNTNSYNLDELLAAKSRTSQKALVIEVRKNEDIAQQALRQLKSDLTNEFRDVLESEEVINTVNELIVSVYRVYGNDSSNAEYAKQLVTAKIREYLKKIVNKDISFDITIYDNRANITYKIPDSFIDTKFMEYYNRFCSEYKKNQNVSIGGLAISDSKSCSNANTSTYANALLGGSSTQKYYGTSSAYCSDLTLHECSTDSTCSNDLNSMINNSVPSNLETLVNELKKVFVTKKNQSDRVETEYIKAINGLFKTIQTGDLKMNNLTADDIIGKNVTTDNLAVTSGLIELSEKTSPNYHKLYVNEDNLLTIETNGEQSHLITAEYIDGLEDLLNKLRYDVSVFEAKIGVLPEDKTLTEAIDDTFAKKVDVYTKDETYTKVEVDNKIDIVEDSLNNYYTKSESDRRLENTVTDAIANIHNIGTWDFIYPDDTDDYYKDIFFVKDSMLHVTVEPWEITYNGDMYGSLYPDEPFDLSSLNTEYEYTLSSFVGGPVVIMRYSSAIGKNFYTKEETDKQIKDAISNINISGGGGSLGFNVVVLSNKDDLVDRYDPHTIYLVPNNIQFGETQDDVYADYYYEYVYIPEIGNHELIGTTNIKIDDKSIKDWINSKDFIDKNTLDSRLSSYYTKKQIDKQLEDLNFEVDLSNYYTKSEADTKIDRVISSIHGLYTWEIVEDPNSLYPVSATFQIIDGKVYPSADPWCVEYNGETIHFSPESPLDLSRLDVRQESYTIKSSIDSESVLLLCHSVINKNFYTKEEADKRTEEIIDDRIIDFHNLYSWEVYDITDDSYKNNFDITDNLLSVSADPWTIIDISDGKIVGNIGPDSSLDLNTLDNTKTYKIVTDAYIHCEATLKYTIYIGKNFYTKDEVNTDIVGTPGTELSISSNLQELISADGTGDVFGNTFSREQILKILKKIYDMLSEDYVAKMYLTEEVEKIIQGPDSKVDAIAYLDIDDMEG